VRTAALIGIFALLGEPAFACTFAPGYQAFRVAPVLRPTLVPATAPTVTVESIERGYDDGDGGSCSDAGILVLKVPSDSVGYHFEVVAGGFDDVVFPQGYVRTVEPGRLRFVWLDGDHDWQESVDVLLRVTTISSDGVPSEPQVLRIRHPGGASARR
jgi:hypothetical protein